MNLIRIIFLGLAVLLPTAWTVAQAAADAPAGTKPADTTTEKKEKKAKKAGSGPTEGEKKAEEKK